MTVPMVITNYLKGSRVPQPEHAWALGEGLRKTVPWMNGYCMLWATGAYETALATTFEYIVQHDNIPGGDVVQMLWAGATAGTDLPRYRSVFDFEPDVLKHMATHVDETSEIAAFLKSKVAAPSPEYSFPDSPDFDTDVYECEEKLSMLRCEDSPPNDGMR